MPRRTIALHSIKTDRTTMTIAELEADLQAALENLRELEREGRLPAELRPLLLLSPTDGASVHVSLRHRDKARQVRRSYGAQAFSQRTCGAWLVFEVPHHDWEDTRPGGEPAEPFEGFVRALDQAQGEPQLSFVSLKWFRDVYLSKFGFAWAEDPDTVRRLLYESIDRGALLTEKVPNPRSPEHPVTAIRLNREHPEVRGILGLDTADPGSAHAPGASDAGPRGPA